MKCDCAQNPSMHYEENARFKRSKLDMAASAPAPISTGGEGASAGAGLHPREPTSNGALLHQLTSSSPSSDMISAAILASRGQPMNLPRIALASIAAFFTYFAVGGLVFGLLPWMRNEFLKYPNIYRTQEGIKSTMPIGMAFMFLAIVVLAVLYAMLYQGGSGVTEGARFGALIGVFAIGSFVVHNYVNLQIGIKLTVQQGIAYFVEWVIVGLVIGLIYRPAH
jgi:uncharacterized membrane protein YidH (DUF202 family)